MKIVGILGGLGNQLFQYAFSRELARRSGERVLVDTSGFERYGLHNGFELERLFGLVLERADPGDVRRLSTASSSLLNRLRRRLAPKRSNYIDRNFSFHDDVFSLDGDIYYEGFWQSERYFEGVARELRAELTFPRLSSRNIQFIAGLPRPACSVHVRRGDYLEPQNRHLNVCGPGYYERAIGAIAQGRGVASFVVFSDDVEWCERELAFGDAEVAFVDWNRGRESWQDMAMMAACDHHIIANSSFSWWGAWLGEGGSGDREVIAPSVWARVGAGRSPPGYRFEYADTVPERWTRME